MEAQTALYLKGKDFFDKKKYAKAAPLLDECVCLMRRCGRLNSGEGCNALALLGIAWSGCGEPLLAVRALEEELDLLVSLGQSRTDRYAISLNNLGKSLFKAAKFGEAVVRLEECKRLKEGMGKVGTARYASTLCWLGRALDSSGEPLRAVSVYEQALSLLASLGQSISDEYTSTLHNLGCALCNAGKYAEGITRLEESRCLQETLGKDNVLFYSSTLISLARASCAIGNNEMALLCSMQSRSLLQRLNKTSGVEFFLTLVQLGLCSWLDVPKVQSLLEYASQSRALGERLTNTVGQETQLVTALLSLKDLQCAHISRFCILQGVARLYGGSNIRDAQLWLEESRGLLKAEPSHADVNSFLAVLEQQLVRRTRDEAQRVARAALKSDIAEGHDTLRALMAEQDALEVRIRQIRTWLAWAQPEFQRLEQNTSHEDLQGSSMRRSCRFAIAGSLRFDPLQHLHNQHYRRYQYLQ